jgi:hypothetical protein
MFEWSCDLSTSAEAFAKFREWSNSRTALKLTFSDTEGASRVIYGQITGIDEEKSVVGFTEDRSRNIAQFGFTDASFTVGKRTLMAERTNGEFWKCEET